MCNFIKKMYGNEYLGQSVGPLDQYSGQKLVFFLFSENYQKLSKNTTVYLLFDGY